MGILRILLPILLLSYGFKVRGCVTPKTAAIITGVRHFCTVLEEHKKFNQIKTTPKIEVK
jgi:hypothetical protein